MDVQQPWTTPIKAARMVRLPRKVIFTGASLILAWLIVAVLLRSLGCPGDTVRGWLELANGATWPSDWHEVCLRNPGSFALVLAARTSLNFAGPLAVIVTGIWLVTGGLERYMQMSRLELMRMLSTEIVSSLAPTLRNNHPSFDPERELPQLQQVADGVVEAYLADVRALERSGKLQQTSDPD